MSGWIADELREWVNAAALYAHQVKDLRAIADRIDEAYERAVREASEGNGLNLSTHPELASDEWLDERGLMRRPVDADGRPWHVGDVADYDGEGVMVDRLKLKKDGWWVGLYAVRECRRPGNLRHHKPTPAERIRECAQDLARGECARLDPRLGDDLLTTVSARLAAVADELEGAE